jgi:cytochrome b6-f complex iron-sulfur subunit
VIRVGADRVPRPIERRQLLRLGFLGIAGLAATELAVALAPFLKVTRISGLGAPFTVPYPKSEVLALFASTNDEPILFAQSKFFLIRPPGGIAAAYRKCQHLGCAVPFNKAEDQFHCPCHQSIYEKRTALLIDGPASYGLDLFPIREEGDHLIVDTNPLNRLVRDDNEWHDEHLQVRA